MLAPLGLRGLMKMTRYFGHMCMKEGVQILFTKNKKIKSSDCCRNEWRQDEGQPDCGITTDHDFDAMLKLRDLQQTNRSYWTDAIHQFT